METVKHQLDVELAKTQARKDVLDEVKDYLYLNFRDGTNQQPGCVRQARKYVETWPRPRKSTDRNCKTPGTPWNRGTR